MSDIKDIIAGDDGEHIVVTVVRWAVATVVTVLALVLIAMVIHAVLRSEDILFSVKDGFIGADNLYNQTNGIITLGGPGTSSSVNPVTGSKRAAEYVTEIPDVTLQPANTTNLRVSLIANNPGGRTKVDCNQTTVTLTDMQDPPYEIGTLKLDPFTVPPQTTITLHKRLKIDNKKTLSRILEHHRGADSFGVTVRVSANITSYPLGKAQTKRQTYVCGKVTVGLQDDEVYLATDDAQCTRPGQLPS